MLNIDGETLRVQPLDMQIPADLAPIIFNACLVLGTLVLGAMLYSLIKRGMQERQDDVRNAEHERHVLALAAKRREEIAGPYSDYPRRAQFEPAVRARAPASRLDNAGSSSALGSVGFASLDAGGSCAGSSDGGASCC